MASDPEAADVSFIQADWPAPVHVRAVATTRDGGVSTGRFATLNLGAHVGDDPALVDENRALVQAALGFAQGPIWMKQMHSASLLELPAGKPLPEADAAITVKPGVVCAVLTADCLPLVFTDVAGQRIAVAHAGWRGLWRGILESCARAFIDAGSQPEDILVWLGPAIGPQAYEVGVEVRQAFVAKDTHHRRSFVPSRPGHWHMDLAGIARRVLAGCGITAISSAKLCTHSDSRFFSHRRDGPTGRQATLAWIEPEA